MEETSSTLERFWNAQLLETGGQTIHVSNVVIGLALVIAGFTLARHVARLFRMVFLPRVPISTGASAAVEAIFFYLLLVIVAYSALAVANVPLTAFTLLGGAAAIGVGFGSQTLVSNFIAGLILLFEQPLRRGDLVQIDDLYGNVIKVGARSTTIRTGDSVDILVPNATFLEQKIINWSLNDVRVRMSVTVGVAYGSPTELVAQILRQAMAEHERVMPTPAPLVLFSDFGDNALVFDAYFWIEMRTQMEGRLVASELRFKIDALCREHHITIAYPQRDVHLDTLRPLEVRVLEPEKSS